MVLELSCPCFCGGTLREGQYFKYGYLDCEECGTCKSINPEDPKILYDKAYWTHERGHSTIAEQWYNLETPFRNQISAYASANPSPSRVEFWWDMIRHLPLGKSFEIGCAPGTFMSCMAKRGWDVYGCEPNSTVCEEVSAISKMKVSEGLFPCKIEGFYDLFLALDVLEHAPDPVWFMKATHINLKPEGYVLVQAPTMMGEEQDFGEFTERLFEQKEHIYLFKERGIKLLFSECGFHLLDYKRWVQGHECFLLRRKND
jgi:hypothetical protein